MTPEQERKLDEIYDFMLKMRASTTIPFDVDQAIRTRLAGELGLTVSAKGATSENQAVDEGGVATYNVLSNPTGFLEITISGTVYYLPYY